MGISTTMMTTTKTTHPHTTKGLVVSRMRDDFSAPFVARMPESFWPQVFEQLLLCFHEALERGANMENNGQVWQGLWLMETNGADAFIGLVLLYFDNIENNVSRPYCITTNSAYGRHLLSWRVTESA